MNLAQALIGMTVMVMALMIVAEGFHGVLQTQTKVTLLREERNLEIELGSRLRVLFSCSSSPHVSGTATELEKTLSPCVRVSQVTPQGNPSQVQLVFASLYEAQMLIPWWEAQNALGLSWTLRSLSHHCEVRLTETLPALTMMGTVLDPRCPIQAGTYQPVLQPPRYLTLRGKVRTGPKGIAPRLELKIWASSVTAEPESELVRLRSYVQGVRKVSWTYRVLSKAYLQPNPDFTLLVQDLDGNDNRQQDPGEHPSTHRLFPAEGIDAVLYHFVIDSPQRAIQEMPCGNEIIPKGAHQTCVHFTAPQGFP